MGHGVDALEHLSLDSDAEKRCGSYDRARDRKDDRARWVGSRGPVVNELIGNAGEIVDKTIVSLLMQFGRRFGAADREDIAQEAYAKILERHNSGARIEAPLALVKKTARNIALDRIRWGHFETAEDPSAEPFASAAGSGDPEYTVLTRVDLARGIEAAEQLPAVQQAVYRAIVVDELRPAEACKRLGIPRSTLFKYQKAALAHVQSAQLQGVASPYAEAERELLSAYAFGLASPPQRRRVERLIRNSPEAASLLRELRQAHRAAALALPLAPASREFDLSWLERLLALPGRARDAAASLVSRTGDDAAAAASTAAGSGAGRGAGGVLAALGGAGKAAIACLGTGAAVSACVAGGILPLHSSPDSDAEGEAASSSRHALAAPSAQLDVAALAGATPSVAEHTRAAEESAKPKKESQRDGSRSSKVAQAPAVEPVVAPTAPPVEQEFGVGAAATPVTGAPPDTNDSNGAAASTVTGEFGP